MDQSLYKWVLNAYRHIVIGLETAFKWNNLKYTVEQKTQPLKTAFAMNDQKQSSCSLDV